MSLSTIELYAAYAYAVGLKSKRKGKTYKQPR